MKTLKQQLKSTGRKLYIDDDVLETASKKKHAAKVEFFHLGRYVSDDELEKEYAARGLEPATIPDIVAFDTKQRKEMDEMMFVCTHWKDEDGRWCFATFSRWHDGRHVHVDRGDGGWDDYWWFCGVRKDAFNRPKRALTHDDEPGIEKRLLSGIKK